MVSYGEVRKQELIVSHFTPVSSLLGGMLIGLSATLLLLCNGRVAGISGILGGVVGPARGSVGWRALFLLGLAGTGAVAGRLWPAAFQGAPRSLLVAVVAGLLVGFGTQLGGGCTSGHGVCGISRRSGRSLLATLTFVATGIATVAVVRHLPSLAGTP